MAISKASLTIVADQNIRWAERYFNNFGKVKFVSGRQLKKAQLLNADVLLVRSVTKVNAALLAGTSVKFVGSATIGTDHVDLDYLASQRIGFANAPGSNANSVVEYVLAALCQLVPKAGSFLNKTVGIIGAGNVGSRLARQCQALGLKVQCYDPLIQLPKGLSACTFEQALNSDIISLHTPLTYKDSGEHATFHLLDQDRLFQLPAGTTLINTCRGAVIDNRALLNRLQDRHDLHVVLDVWENEPDISKALLKSVALGTPHIAGYSVDGKVRATKMIYDAFCEYQESCGSYRPENKLQALPENVGYHSNACESHQCIDMSGKLSELELLCKVIGAAHRIGDDYQDLLAAMAATCCNESDEAESQAEQAGSKSAEAFDALRNNYPNQYEWHNVSVRIANRVCTDLIDADLASDNQTSCRLVSSASLDKLRALGFTIELE